MGGREYKSEKPGTIFNIHLTFLTFFSRFYPENIPAGVRGITKSLLFFIENRVKDTNGFPKISKIHTYKHHSQVNPLAYQVATQQGEGWVDPQVPGVFQGSTAPAPEDFLVFQYYSEAWQYPLNDIF